MDKLVLYNDVVVHSDVRNSFLSLRQFMINTLGMGIDIVESVKSDQEIIYELYNLYKYKKELPKIGTQKRIVDVDISSSDSVINDNQQNYNAIKTFLENSAPDKFEPVIGPNKVSNRSSSEILYSIPNYPQYDPRRSGRIIRIGPKTIINPTTIRFMVKNAGNFGFVHYGPYDPTVWYWRGDISPFTYTEQQVVSYMNTELVYYL